jgi:hypothetical protein
VGWVGSVVGAALVDDLIHALAVPAGKAIAAVEAGRTGLTVFGASERVHVCRACIP